MGLGEGFKKLRLQIVFCCTGNRVGNGIYHHNRSTRLLILIETTVEVVILTRLVFQART
jgi:hypothetical protein